MASISDFDTDAKGRPSSTAEIITARGTRIYLMPVETYPGHINNLYLVVSPEYSLLVDVGTVRSNEQMEERFQELQRNFGVELGPESVDEVLITHAHMDHFGNTRRFAEANIPVAIHELDARVLMEFEERLVLASRDLGIFMYRSGVADAYVKKMVGDYQSAKSWFTSVEPSKRLRNHDTLGPGWPVLHVPGHCPGLVCLAIDDVVLTTDHLLTRITPAQAPQSLTPYTGLENYLRSLGKLRNFGNFQLGLGAHEAPIHDIWGRIDETIDHHHARLKKIHDFCAEPRTVVEISKHLFGALKGYTVQLGLTEAGAHVEFLHELGFLLIDNLTEVAADLQAPNLYRQSARPLPHPSAAKHDNPRR